MSDIHTEIEEFINYCKNEKNLNVKTIEAYSTDLTQFENFLNEKKFSVEVKEISKTEIRKYLDTISLLKPMSVKRKVATLKAMFYFLEYEDKIIVSPFKKMKIKIDDTTVLPQVMVIKDINSIFELAYQKKCLCKDLNSFSYFESLRNIVVLELLFATGARVSEIANIYEEDIDFSLGIFSIKGKGSRERTIQISNEETLKVINEYHKLFKKKITIAGGSFIVNRLGKKLSDQSIRGIVSKLSKEANIPEHITPFVFRHTLATLLLEKGVDMKYIQSLLGHRSIVTTEIYAHINHEKQNQILSNNHPRKDFSIKV